VRPQALLEHVDALICFVFYSEIDEKFCDCILFFLNKSLLSELMQLDKRQLYLLQQTA
jgi:hypothetical protein